MEKINLAGEWKFRLDYGKEGIKKKYYSDDLEDTINLPGTTAQQKKGEVNPAKETGYLTETYHFAESDRRHKIAGLFCKAFEKAVLLTPTEENVRIWAECTRMTPEEIEDSAKEAHGLAVVFSAIAGVLETMIPGRDDDAG